MTENDVTLPESPNLDISFDRTPVISGRTKMAGVIMLLVLAAGVTLDYLASTSKLGDAADLTLAFLMLMPLGIAALILPVAVSFAPGTIRTQWVLFGLGTLTMGIGNLVLVVLYLITGSDPYPSIGDVFTLAGYILFAAGLFLAIRGYRRLLDYKVPGMIATIVGVAAMAAVYLLVISPYVIFAPEGTQSLATRVFNTLYPVLDVLVLFTPAVMLGLLVSKLGSGRVAWPWWFVVASAGTLGLADTLFAYATYVGARRIPLIDAGYALAPLLLGFAVLVAWDVYHS